MLSSVIISVHAVVMARINAMREPNGDLSGSSPDTATTTNSNSHEFDGIKNRINALYRMFRCFGDSALVKVQRMDIGGTWMFNKFQVTKKPLVQSGF